MASSSLSDKNFKFAFAGWWLTWSVLHVLVLLNFNVAYTYAIADSITSNALLATTCLVITNNMRYYLPRQEKYWYVLLVSLALSALWLLVVRVILWFFFGTNAAYMTLLLQSSMLRYALAFLMTGCMALMSLVWYTQQEQKETDERKIAAEQIAREAELYKLRQQLQPHFLFNSLNSISALTGREPEKARHMIQQLSDFLRGTLKKDELVWTTLEEELQYLKLYLDIEKVRFGYRLTTETLCSDDVLSMKLPAMILQPLVENAIKFGLYDTVGEVTISIVAKNVNGFLEVSVQNPFDEDTTSTASGTGFGLASIQRRLFLLFFRNDLLKTSKENNSFTTTITIPQLA